MIRRYPSARRYQSLSVFFFFSYFFIFFYQSLSVCAIAALFPYNLKEISSSLFSKEETISGDDNSILLTCKTDVIEKTRKHFM